ncbi:aminotransferase class I/II-fold pyridoxal phosphate-dependent enzyme [Polyangium sp. 15x6]|uniref:pyridoxal phosphate-dependent aminotransferase n=1 Tax=Polyangium sp. 15x6 TaxID=3042687 RepID=UPI00249B5C63|nr:aminotransferase class I/II-fold pyridoxal phosphate-dependent enzyme [Polyangium sp. 15x6]MDI3288318.1 aminotransferase class I/II-fold pyridoxal phosphate-dependent enzyme [Polyangium sp. 15x6]
MNDPSPLAFLVRPELAELAAYVPHPGTYAVQLNANEAPDLLSPDTRRALADAMLPPSLGRYPESHAESLRELVAARVGAGAHEVLATAGSVEAISLLIGTLGRPRQGADAATMVTTTPTFFMYKHCARMHGMHVVEVPLDDAWDLDVEAMRHAITRARPNLVFIATPNTPTSNAVSEDRLRAIIEAAPDSLVVIDEAYAAFARQSAGRLRREYPHVAVLGSLSKLGFAALRVGWVVGPAAILHEVDKFRLPYNVPGPSLRGAVFVLRELGAELVRLTSFVIHEREKVAVALAGMGFGVAPSEANFLWVDTKGPCKEIFEGLAADGVLVQSHHAREGRIARHLRITVGMSHENDRLLETIARWAPGAGENARRG